MLRSAEVQSSDQLSIREINPTLIPDAVRDILGLAAPGVAPGRAAPSSDQPDYEPPSGDTRTLVLRAIRAWQGQARFRAMLRERYGDACMITGSTAIDVVEAAHISPYRGPADNHPDNGLLLRADLHTLFDLDLLAIDPTSLVVHVHPKVVGAGYAEIDGVDLRLGGASRPSEAALRERWMRYRATIP